MEMELTLTGEEVKLIEIYRQLDISDRELALIILERLSGSLKQSRPIVSNHQRGRNINFQINSTYHLQDVGK